MLLEHGARAQMMARASTVARLWGTCGTLQRTHLADGAVMWWLQFDKPVTYSSKGWLPMRGCWVTADHIEPLRPISYAEWDRRERMRGNAAPEWAYREYFARSSA